MTVFLVCLGLFLICLTTLGKIAMLKILQGLLAFVASFGLFIYVAALYYWKATA